MRLTRPRPAPAEEIDGGTLDACRRGDRAALDRVLRQHAPALERFATRLLGPGADAEDLLQATLLAAVGAFPRFRGEATVRTWLMRIAVHLAHEHLRRPERRRRVALDLVRPQDEPRDEAAAPDRTAQGRRDLERLHVHLASLNPMRRVAFVLHVVEGRPIEEVAALVGASRVATKSRIFWARRALLRHVRKDPALRHLVRSEEEP